MRLKRQRRLETREEMKTIRCYYLRNYSFFQHRNAKLKEKLLRSVRVNTGRKVWLTDSLTQSDLEHQMEPRKFPTQIMKEKLKTREAEMEYVWTNSPTQNLIRDTIEGASGEFARLPDRDHCRGSLWPEAGKPEALARPPLVVDSAGTERVKTDYWCKNWLFCTQTDELTALFLLLRSPIKMLMIFSHPPPSLHLLPFRMKLK